MVNHGLRPEGDRWAKECGVGRAEVLRKRAPVMPSVDSGAVYTGFGCTVEIWMEGWSLYCEPVGMGCGTRSVPTVLWGSEGRRVEVYAETYNGRLMGKWVTVLWLTWRGSRADCASHCTMGAERAEVSRRGGV